MAFGQSSGPPASARDVAQLVDLLEQAGHGSLKDARHPLGLTQRQAAGKFTRDEVTDLIARLETEIHARELGGPPDQVAAEVPTATGSPSDPRAERRRREQQRLLAASLTDDLMAAELELRGWTCIPPLT